MSSIPDARDDLSIESTARWAFHLSYFLLADRRDACSVFYQAAARLYVTALAQKRRKAKRPKGEVHKKLSLTPLPLLQYLIYLCAEPYEDAQEREHWAGAGGLTVEDMIVRYVKHLMLLYLEHNSFYATVGQSCVLFDFGTGQAGRLYETLVQGSDAHLDTKGDYSVRDAKRELRRRLAGRFGRFVTTYDGTRGEQRFVPMSDAGAHFRLVKLCLHRLRPVQEAGGQTDGWHLPPRFDPSAYDLAELQYDGRNADPGAEQAAELRRVHAVTHSCCWARLLRALGFNYSRRRIVLPEFTLTSDENTGRRPPHHRRRPPELTPAELDGLTKVLRNEARRRKGLFASSLSVSVDGSPCVSWSVRQNRAVEISVGAGARVLAVSARDKEGELLLAQYLFRLGGVSRHNEVEQPAVTLEGGQEFTFTVSNPPEAGAGYVVTIRFRETRPHRAAALYLARGFGWFAEAPPVSDRRPARLKAAVTVCATLLALLLAGWWAARTLRRNPQPLPVALNGIDQPTTGPPEDSESGPPPSPGGRVSPGQGEAGGGPGAAPSDKGPRRRPSSGRAASGVNRASRQAGGPSAVGARPPSEVALSILDGGRLVSMDGRGRFTGLEGLPPKWRSAIESALLARRVSRPPVLEGLGGGMETLRGGPRKAGGADILGPAGAVVESDRPLFRWRPPGVEARYIVSVFDSHYNQVTQSGLLSATEWSPPRGLKRGAAYVWKVTTVHHGEAISSPGPLAPEARFRVLGQTAADELARARRLRPDSHLTLGVLYARAGMVNEAEREFQALVESNPDSSVARNLLLSVREWPRPR